MGNDLSQEVRITTLQRVPFFGGISEGVIASLLERATIVERAGGEYFFEQGDSGTSAFVLERGEVAILRRYEEKEHALRTLGTGDCFGEVALLDFGARSASVKAISDCQAIELTGTDILSVLSIDCQQFAMIYMNLGREIGRRLREADERLFKAQFSEHGVADGWRFGSG